MKLNMIAVLGALLALSTISKAEDEDFTQNRYPSIVAERGSDSLSIERSRVLKILTDKYQADVSALNNGLLHAYSDHTLGTDDHTVPTTYHTPQTNTHVLNTDTHYWQSTDHFESTYEHSPSTSFHNADTTRGHTGDSLQ